jgi:hypothetical protein
MKEYSDRCHRCDQPKSTHDDGECAGVTRSMMSPASARHCKHGIPLSNKAFPCVRCMEDRQTSLQVFKKEGEPNYGQR